ncbi:MAG: DUF3291 domain-containing protein [Pseudomonadota bacterium]
MHLAEFNIGTLKYDWEDPRVADFRDNLDRVYDIARRSPGYIWHMENEDMEAAQLEAGGPLGANPRTASTLSVWRDVDSFRQFVFHTVHKQFYDRKAEWYDAAAQGTRLVMWWVAPGHIPTVTEAVARLRHLDQHGPSDHAFGWDHLQTRASTGIPVAP